jgi:hypothetical protein
MRMTIEGTQCIAQKQKADDKILQGLFINLEMEIMTKKLVSKRRKFNGAES